MHAHIRQLHMSNCKSRYISREEPRSRHLLYAHIHMRPQFIRAYAHIIHNTPCLSPGATRCHLIPAQLHTHIQYTQQTLEHNTCTYTRIKHTYRQHKPINTHTTHTHTPHCQHSLPPLPAATSCWHHSLLPSQRRTILLPNRTGVWLKLSRTSHIGIEDSVWILLIIEESVNAGYGFHWAQGSITH